MEFRQLEVFMAVAETKSFSKAADQLLLSQSSISSNIKNLEHELKKTLFIRSTKSLCLSPDGVTFLWYAKRILETKDASFHALNTPSETVLHLGASTIPSSYLLPGLISKFRDSHPHTFFEIRQGDSSETIDRLLDGTIELGLIGQNDQHPNCHYIPFCRDEFLLITPSNNYYQALKRQSPELPRLLKEPFIFREQGSGTKRAIDRYLASIHLSPNDLNVVARSNDLESIKQMVISGLGVSIFSKYAVQDLLKSGQVIAYPLDSDACRSFYLVYLKGRMPKPVMKDFIDFTTTLF